MSEENITKQNSKEASIRKGFWSKHTFVGAVILIIVTYIFTEAIVPLTFFQVSISTGINLNCFTILGALVALLIYYLVVRKEYQGNFIGGQILTGFRLAAFMLIYYVYLIIQILLLSDFRRLSFDTIIIAVMAGVVEETIFRAIPISYMLRNWKEENKILIVMFLSSITFGCMHFVNILSGASISITVVQVIATIGMGLLFSAIFIRGGNILPAMIAHGLTDAIAFMDATQVSEEGLMAVEASFINYVDVAVCVILGIIAIYLVRPAKRQEILTLWDNKWKYKK